MQKTAQTAKFYDGYWPQNVPDYEKTKEHVFSIVPQQRYKLALDGGCGTGVNALALAELADKVFGLDISRGSLMTAQGLAKKLDKDNIDLGQASLLQIPFKDKSFDLVYSWGVIHHTVDPGGAFRELVRILKPDGCLVLAVYLKTNLTFIHEAIRKICLSLPGFLKNLFIKMVVGLVGIIGKFKTLKVVRDDNPYLESKIEDWFFVPEKHFYTIAEMRCLYEENGLSFELLNPKTGRFKSTSNFIVRGWLKS